MWIWGFLGQFFSCVLDLCECDAKRGSMSADWIIGIIHQIILQPAPPAQPSLNRRLRWEVGDWAWTDRATGKRESKMGSEVKFMDKRTDKTLSFVCHHHNLLFVKYSFLVWRVLGSQGKVLKNDYGAFGCQRAFMCISELKNRPNRFLVDGKIQPTT